MPAVRRQAVSPTVCCIAPYTMLSLCMTKLPWSRVPKPVLSVFTLLIPVTGVTIRTSLRISVAWIIVQATIILVYMGARTLMLLV